MLRWSCATLIVLLAGPSLSAQKLLRTYEGAYLHQVMGGLDVVGDVDRDGWNELIVGDSAFSPAGVFEAGRVAVLDGRTEQIIFEVNGTLPNQRLGISVLGVGDMSGDGIPDFVASSLGGLKQGFVWSGADGTLLANVDTFGACDGLGDVDGDGLMDFVFGRAGGQFGVTFGGRFETVYIVQGPPYPGLIHFGLTLASVGDVDEDGVQDFAVSAPGSSQKAFCVLGSVFIFSGADGELLNEFHGPGPDSLFGWGIAYIGDANGQGGPDIAIGAPACCWDCLQPGPGRTQSFDARTGQVMPSYSITFDQGLDLGRSVSGVGDLNGNGLDDVLVGASPALLVALEGSTSQPIFDGFRGHCSLFSSLVPAGDVNDDDFPDFYTQGRCSLPARVNLYSSEPIGVHTLGKPCSSPAGTAARIGVSGTPALGTTLTVHLSRIHVHQDAVLRIGPSATLGSGARTPMALPGCDTLVQRGQVFPAAVTSIRPGEGAASVDVQLPPDPALAGTRIYVQWTVRERPGRYDGPPGPYPAVRWARTRVLELTLQ